MIVKLPKQNKQIKKIKNKKKRKTKEINGERWTNKHKQTRNKINKQTNKPKKPSRFKNNRISVLIVAMLLLHHPVLVLVFKHRSVLVSPGGWAVFCLSVAVTHSAPPSVWCGSLSLYVVLRFWRSAL
jgi:hypothetical protein